MTEVTNPVEIEKAIHDVSNRIGRGVKVCDERYGAFLTADRQYDQQYAAAYLDANQHPAHERKYLAELETINARQERDEAEAAYKYADRLAKALDLELRALQSIGASVRSMYQTAGVGER